MVAVGLFSIHHISPYIYIYHQRIATVMFDHVLVVMNRTIRQQIFTDDHECLFGMLPI